MNFHENSVRLYDMFTRNQTSRYGGILIQNKNQNHLLCAIVSDCMVYPNPKLNIKNLGSG